jgi:hypothetical protein
LACLPRNHQTASPDSATQQSASQFAPPDSPQAVSGPSRPAHKSAATLALNSTGKLGRLPDFIDAIVATIVPTKISVGTTVAFSRYPAHTVLTERLRTLWVGIGMTYRATQKPP